MKRMAVTLLGAGLCLLLAAPALAKGPGEEITRMRATVKGRGLAVPITLTSRRSCGVVFPCFSMADLDDPLVNLATLTGVATSPPSYARSYDVPPSGSTPLGPRYEITYTVTFGDGVSASVVQEVYPWAGSHVWVYTPAGQRLPGREINGGWTPGPLSLRSALTDLGVPAAPSSAVGEPIVDTSSPGSPVAVIGVASALLMTLLAGGILVARSRRRPRPAAVS
ncbi:MAG TPA: hypothetical protein VF972_08295 [Actinomycetota bacterium]